MLIWKFDEKASKVKSLGHVSTFQDQLNGSMFHPLDHHLVITYGPRFTLYNKGLLILGFGIAKTNSGNKT